MLPIAADPWTGRFCQGSKIGEADAEGALGRFCPAVDNSDSGSRAPPARRSDPLVTAVCQQRPGDLLLFAPADPRGLAGPERERQRERRLGRRVGGASGPAAPALELRVPAGQGLACAGQQATTRPVASQPALACIPGDGQPSPAALEADRTVPPSGNLWIGGQQVWLGPALARKITIWVDEASLDVLLDGTRLKTLPSRLGVTELARLAADGAARPGHRRCRRETPRPSRWSGWSTPLALSAWPVPSSTSVSSWPVSGSRCAWTAPRWPSSATTGTPADHALPRPHPRPAPAARRTPGHRHPGPPGRAGHRPAARLLPAQHYGRHPENPRRPHPRPQDRLP